VTVRCRHFGDRVVDRAIAGLVTIAKQDPRCLPSQFIEDADRNKEVLREAGNIDVAQCEGSLAEAAELGAEARFVEPVLGSRRECGSALHGHLVGTTATDEREWLAGGAQCPDIY